MTMRIFKLTKTQIAALMLAHDATDAGGELSSHFRYETVRKLLDLELVEGIGDGNAFRFWPTDAGRELCKEIRAGGQEDNC